MMPSVEFLWIVAAVFLGSVPAFILAAWQRRGPRYLNQVSELEQPEEGEAMSDVYVQEVLPLQEREHPELARRLREVAQRLAREKGEITSDDIHAAHPIPQGIDPRIMGAAFTPKKLWLRTGQQQSKRRENHGRWISTWSLRETAS